MNENRKLFLSSTLSIFLIVALAAFGKSTELARAINLNNAILAFPFTFIITAYVVDTLGSKWAKKNVYNSAIMILLFLLMLVFISFFRGNDPTYYYRASLEFIFTPKNTKIFGLSFSYPALLQTGLYIGGFIIAHIIFISLYKATKELMPKIVSFMLCYLIAYTINIIIVIGLDGIVNIMNKNIDFRSFIQVLTANFMGVIATCLIATIIYSFAALTLKPKEKIIIKSIS